MENLLKCPHARAHPGCEVSCHGTCIVSSSVIHQGQPDSRESCIVLQSGPTRSHVAKFSQRSVVACSVRISCCRGRTLQTRPRTSVCEPLMPDVMLPKCIRTIAQLCEVSGPTLGFTTQEFSIMGGYMENPEKPQNCQKWGVGACTGMGACSGQYGISTSATS